MERDSNALVPLAKPEAIGLGVGRRTLGRRIISDPDFPAVIRMNGRLYIKRGDLDAYRGKLVERSLLAPVQRPKPANQQERGPNK